MSYTTTVFLRLIDGEEIELSSKSPIATIHTSQQGMITDKDFVEAFMQASLSGLPYFIKIRQTNSVVRIISHYVVKEVQTRTFHVLDK